MNYRKKNLICIVPAAIALAGLLYFFKKKRVVKKLFIIGNGFDLYHGIPSSYLQFRDFLHDDDFETYKALENYLGFYDDDQWRDFESKLAALNSEDLLDEMRIFLGNPGSDDWKDSMYHDFQYEVGQVVDHLNGKMRQSFLRWILQLDTRHRSLRLRLSLPKTEVFLSFNYTDSLEELYKIPFAQILYIHGKAVNKRSKIILGHSWTNFAEATREEPTTYQDFVDGDYANEEDWQWKEAKALIESYFASSFKNASIIIKKNKRFFTRLRQVKDVYVMGHSMNDVDKAYYEAIVSEIDSHKVKWTVSYYNEADIQRCSAMFYSLGISSSQIRFELLEDFYSNQLKLFL